ncbi:unnamed protein product [Adineta steineri]|uniref:TauD/TfdA-like domain-containing protein n=1 Tax=Adineta steineri TaxID=433720 RepID=A0A819F7S1_9BILA|nr:unnamed protein product [Adineta steineri]CAF3864076.1 unnamed protein product [Adineta steineri]
MMGMLYAKVIPKQGGGDTLWVNMVELYNQELSSGMKEMLSKLTAEHSMIKSHKQSLQHDDNDDNKNNSSLTNHPVICEHGIPKEKYLYVNMSATTKINELNEEESNLLLKYLFSLVSKRPDLICRWKWSENDVCLWHQPTTQHYATANYWPQHRQMHRCAIMQRTEII